jgi:hypothetical protein
MERERTGQMGWPKVHGSTWPFSLFGTFGVFLVVSFIAPFQIRNLWFGVSFHGVLRELKHVE